MYCVILCGGSGTRLWPLSRKNYPKQFLKLYSKKSLLQETFLRMKGIIPSKNIFLVTNQENFFNVFNQIKEIEKDFDRNCILVEPLSLNTAPAMALAVKYLKEKIKVNLKTPIIVVPSDHYIGNKKSYASLVKIAGMEVGENIGTIGITPDKPEVGYGYIKKGEKEKGKNYFKVKEFKEKPDKNTAQKYLNSGEYVWNSGMYLFNAGAFIRELRAHAGEIYRAMTKSYEMFVNKFANFPSISIDYAISEKSTKVVVFEGDFRWNDIGSFDSLARIKDKNLRHLNFDSKNIYIHTDSNRLVATLGVENLNIIETADSILVQKQGRAEEVKKIVEYLKKNNLEELEHNLIGYRPWGKYEVLINDSNHKVKKITVFPGAKLSLQSHKWRSEHWIVVKGTAKVVNGENILTLHENESTFIPNLTKHRLENPGKTNLEIIEVQTGDYLKEDDIIRYEDVYERDDNIIS